MPTHNPAIPHLTPEPKTDAQGFRGAVKGHRADKAGDPSLVSKQEEQAEKDQQDAVDHLDGPELPKSDGSNGWIRWTLGGSRPRFPSDGRFPPPWILPLSRLLSASIPG